MTSSHLTTLRVGITILSLLLAGQLLAESPRNVTKPHPQVKPALTRIQTTVDSGPFKAEWDSLEGYKIPQWYKDAKLGIFIHWGAYSVPAFGSEWYPRQMYIDAKRRGDNFFLHHKETYGPQKTFGYKDFIPKFKAEKFDAEDIRFTTRDGVLYVIGLKWPKNHKITIKTLAHGGKHFPEDIKSISMLGSKNKLKWARGKNGLHVELPKIKPSEFADVLKVMK